MAVNECVCEENTFFKAQKLNKIRFISAEIIFIYFSNRTT